MDKLIESGRLILRTLNESGYEAYFVGGFVRDYVLNRKSNDIDITTNATPDIVETLFERTVMTGKAFGTITVLIEDKAFEVTTYRKETTYDNHRHPNSIEFAQSLNDDLSRRDFTINQLVMDSEGCVHDAYGGLDDIKNGIIRTIGAPQERFKEDALRMLRAFRFAAQLNFSIEKQTLNAIKERQSLIPKISIERVQDELFKLLDANYSQKAIADMIKTNVHKTLCLEKGLLTLETIEDNYNHLLAFALMDSVEPIAEDMFKFSNRFLSRFKTLSALHQQTFRQGFDEIIVFDYGKFPCLNANIINGLMGDKDRSDEIIALYDNLALKNEKDLKISGKDLLNRFTIDNKRHIARTLRILIERVLKRDIKNEKNILLHHASTILQELKDSE